MGQNNIVLVDTDDLKQIIRDTVFEAVNECLPPAMSDGRDWYTMKEVAEKWGVSVQTIWHYSKLGRIKCSHVGRSVRYEKTYIDNLKALAGAKDGGKTYWTKVEQMMNRKK